ncbi:hypothetical protein MKW92_005782 [Papaver armeniacum]|nr:hypothetical protein MKW92_005782 [Papaver armeniacum]
MSISAADTPSSSTCSGGAQELDPLLKDLNEKKQNFRRNVVSLAAELKHVRNQLASKEEIFGKEMITRQVVEAKAKDMEEEINRLQENLNDRNRKLQASACIAQQYLKEMDDLRSQLSSTLADADASAVSAQSSQLQCLVLENELDEKKNSLKENECRVNTLEEKLVNLQKDLHEREESQKQLKDEVLKMQREIMLAVERAGQREDCELRQILEEASIKNIERISKHLSSKDEEIVKLRDEFRIMSAHWKLKTKDLQSKVVIMVLVAFAWYHEVQSLAFIFFFSFCSYYALSSHGTVGESSASRTGTEKEGTEIGVFPSRSLLPDKEASKGTHTFLLNLSGYFSLIRAVFHCVFLVCVWQMGEKKDKVLEELKNQLDIKQQEESFGIDKQNFWGSSGFKVMASMAMFVLVVFGKR